MRSQIHQGWPSPFCGLITLWGAVGLSPSQVAQAQFAQPGQDQRVAAVGVEAVEQHPVFVTATRSPSPLGTALADHQVIDREHIEAAMGMTLVELIGSLPGVQWVNAGGHGKASSLLLRGTESRHVLLLIDGVRFSSATLGLASLENL
ncbi:MAG: TonB-dependent receptor, partial [Burkholderiaceae bacterium]